MLLPDEYFLVWLVRRDVEQNYFFPLKDTEDRFTLRYLELEPYLIDSNRLYFRASIPFQPFISMSIAV